MIQVALLQFPRARLSNLVAETPRPGGELNFKAILDKTRAPMTDSCCLSVQGETRCWTFRRPVVTGSTAMAMPTTSPSTAFRPPSGTAEDPPLGADRRRMHT